MTTDARPTDPGQSELSALAARRPVAVCCGPGGVGKTTVSATFALQAARAGRRACVVTVDPARRLADALGVESLANTPTRVAGDWPGELHAVMLDTKGTFDDLVARYARAPEQAEAIQANRLYQNLAGALSGTQEYMAMEKLYELTEAGTYDVVVVDTPPTRNALDLLDAPRRLTHFLENRLFRALMFPTRAYFRAVGVAAHALLRTISKVAGAEIVQDAVTFFQAFQGMEEGFRTRAAAVRALLSDPTTAYVVVTSPRRRRHRRGHLLRREAGRHGHLGRRTRRQQGAPALRCGRRRAAGGARGQRARRHRGEPARAAGGGRARGGGLRRTGQASGTGAGGPHPPARHRCSRRRWAVGGCRSPLR